VFFQDATVHDDENSCLACFLSGFFVDDFFLHPDGWNFQLDRLIDDLFDELGTAEDIDDVDLLANIEQGCVSGFAQGLSNFRIDWNYAITIRLHVSGDTVAWAEWAVGESDHGKGFSALQQI